MLALDHAVIPIWDVDASLGFYGETLGLPLVQTLTGDDWGGHPWLMLIYGLEDGRELVLVSLRGAPRPAPEKLPAADVRHYALAAPSREAQDAIHARLQAAGAEITEEMHGERRSLYAPDPNGVVIEITWPASNALAAASPEAMGRARAWLAEAGALTA
jgi:catechol 2,3-dioxygenase-like lactoylglutathione lyase family enzyme